MALRIQRARSLVAAIFVVKEAYYEAIHQCPPAQRAASSAQRRQPATAYSSQ